MRRIIPLVLVAALLLSMNTFSAAVRATETQATEDEITDLSQTSQAPVYGKFVPAETDNQVISVEIAWEGMDFAYNAESAPVWDAENHQYLEPKTEAGWAPSSAYISITNHSDVLLKSEIEYTSSGDAFAEMDLKFASDMPYIGSANTAEGEGEPCTVTIQTIPMGHLDNTALNKAVAGTITISFEEETNYTTLLKGIGDDLEFAEVTADGSALYRGTPYFATLADKTNAAEYLATAVDMADGKVKVTVDGVEQEVAVKPYELNAAMNACFTAYYNKLCLSQSNKQP